MPVTITIVVFCATNLALGWFSGYRSVAGYLTFWLLTGLAVAAARLAVAHVYPHDHGEEQAVRVAVAALAIVVACGLALGGVGHLTTASFLVAQSAIFGGACAFAVWTGGRASPARTPDTVSIPAPVAGMAGALLAFALAFAVTHAPLTLYDSLSYHLFFSARWLQDRALTIIPTPFSDVAQAYAPANGELFFLWLMLPFHGDLLARVGQLPFALLGALTLYAFARRLGAPAQGAVYPAAFFLFSRPILEQAIGANVDLICATLFLTSLFLGLIATERNERRDWILWGVSVGLYAGSKYVALVYLPVLALIVLVRRPSLRILWAAPGVLLFGAPWYVRNWIVAGSPIYPRSLTLGRIMLARGAFGGDAMLHTVFHTNDAALIPTLLAHAFGPTLFLVWLPVVIVGGIAMARRGWWPHAAVLLVPLVMAPLYWFGFPVNIDSRFLMPAIAPALLPFAFVFRSNRTWNAAVHTFFLAALAWIVIGRNVTIPARLPWFMTDWLSLVGLVSTPFVVWFGLLAAAGTIAWRMRPRQLGWAMPFAACLVAVPATALTLGGESWCAPARCEYLVTTSPYIRLMLERSWEWTAANIHHSTIAYTGINLPYPLTGTQLTNRVVYVNTDGRPHWRFHDYDRAFRRGRFNPLPPLLAESSGELMPISQHSGPRDDALRPRYDRMQGIRDAWIDNLRQARADYVFVSVLSAYEIDYVWHNDHGFPIEDEWARTDPHTFPLVYENPQVHIYAVGPAERHPA